MSLFRLCRAAIAPRNTFKKVFQSQMSTTAQPFTNLLLTFGSSARHFSAAPKKLDVKMVKKLRDMTGAPMVDCKNALTEANQQTEVDAVEFAIDWLRKKGKAAAAKKVGRAASEGLVGVVVNEDSTRGVVVELNSETDFVARNEMFHALLHDILNASLQNDKASIPEVMKTKSTVDDGTVDDHFTAVITALRENIQLRRIEVLNAEGSGKVSSYVHGASGSQGNAKLGRIGCLVSVEPLEAGSAGGEDIVSFGGKVAMHVAAGFPKYLDPTAVPEAALKRETDLLLEQAKDSGKPQAVVEKMVQGRIHKYYEDACLIKQQFLISEDGSKQPAVEKVAESKGIKVSGFVRFECGQEVAGEEAQE